jgi:hypothetical protein
MKKILANLSIVVLFITVVSCSGSKNITEQQVVSAAVESSKTELPEKNGWNLITCFRKH